MMLSTTYNDAPQLEASLEAGDFGEDLSNIFHGIRSSSPVRSRALPEVEIIKQKEVDNILPQSPVDTVQQGAFSPIQSLSKTAAARSPSLPQIERRYSWDSKASNEHLVAGDSSDTDSPDTELFPISAKPTGVAALRSSLTAGRGYEALTNRSASPERSYPKNMSMSSTLDQERTAWTSEIPAPAVDVATSLPLDDDDDDDDSTDATPRPRRSIINSDAAYLFSGSPSRLLASPDKQRLTSSTTPKRMTKAQFEQARNMRNSQTPLKNDVESETSDTEELEDEDEMEKHKRMAAQRRRQEATMSVYRQQMKKITGGGSALSELSSPHVRQSIDRNSFMGSNNGHVANIGSSSPRASTVEEEDEDVPLGVLQAHGFPGRNRPPSMMPNAAPAYVPSIGGGDAGPSVAPLPAFARRLPQDPYFGAGLVSPSNRESLSFGHSSPQLFAGPPGGLVGVIASEEKAKASRRGSMNNLLSNGYGPIPLPSNMQTATPPGFQRSSSMASLAQSMNMNMNMNTQRYVPNISPGMSPVITNGPMPNIMSPAEQASLSTQQQIAQLMQMQTQMMQQMMGLQAGQLHQSPSMTSLNGQGMSQPQLPQFQVNPPGTGRPTSTLSQARSMTMLNPPTNWNGLVNGVSPQQRPNTMAGQTRMSYAGSVYGLNGPNPGYVPSIAPSERSNVGMPSRYRPVSIIDTASQDGGDRTSKSLTAASFNPHTSSLTRPRSVSPLTPSQSINELSEVTTPLSSSGKVSKSTAKIMDKLRLVPKSSRQKLANHSKPEEEEEDNAGWAQLAQKRNALRQKRAKKNESISEDAAIAEMVHDLEV